MKSKGVTMIYQYKIDNDKGLIECFLELQHDYPVYIREIERILNVLKQFRSKTFTVVTEENYVEIRIIRIFHKNTHNMKGTVCGLLFLKEGLARSNFLIAISIWRKYLLELWYCVRLK